MIETIFRSNGRPDISYQVSSQLAFRFRRRRAKQIFKMEAMAAILVPVETFLATVDLQVAPILPTTFRVSWPFGSGEEEQNIFS